LDWELRLIYDLIILMKIFIFVKIIILNYIFVKIIILNYIFVKKVIFLKYFFVAGAFLSLEHLQRIS